MTSTDEPTDSAPALSLDDLKRQAIDVLTRASRLRRPGPQGDGAGSVPIDFAELVTQVLAGVAANRGGIGPLLAGRPGSWEAESVRSMLHNTVGENDMTDLISHRTEPVVIPLNLDEIATSAGSYVTYTPATPDDREREIAERAARSNKSPQEWLEQLGGREPVFSRWEPLFPLERTFAGEREQIDDRFGRLDEHASVEHGFDSAEYDAIANRLDAEQTAALAALHAKWQGRYRRFVTEFDRQVQRIAAERQVHVPIEVVVETDPERAEMTAYAHEGSLWDTDALAAELREAAISALPPFESLLTEDQNDENGTEQ